MNEIWLALPVMIAVVVLAVSVFSYRLLQISREAPKYLRRFFAMAPTGIVLLDRQGNIENTNAAFQALIGTANCLGKPLTGYVHSEDRAQLAASLKQTSGEQPAISLRLRLVGATEHTVVAYIAAHGEGGMHDSWVVHFIDTTELTRLETQFAQSQKMQAVGLLAGGIAHDFNNLLTAMIGFCDLLLLRHKAGDQSFADIMQIKQSANRAANLVRQLLAFSRQQTLQPRVLSLTEILADLVHLLRRLMGETIELSIVHGRDVFPVWADQSQLEQVIVNLVVNGRDAMPDGGELTIRTANVAIKLPQRCGDDVMPPGDYVLVEIEDTGTGIPPDTVGRIFEPFFSTKSPGAGTGLGLSTVYGIMRQTGGYVAVQSEVGKGTIFRLYLPAHRAREQGPQLMAPAEEFARDLSGMGTILLVEDEDAVRLFAARALRNKGYRVLEARGGEAALEVAEHQLDEINLVLSDVVMPRIDGPTLIRELRKRRPSLPVVFMSGYAEEDFRRKIDQGEETWFLLKPFTLAQLAQKVKEAI
ncbi:MAG TPA: ATP-binding protein [Dongiaceae bacterium]|jgi:two-component system cell cycle sensor histidine kinase/response regulator CckA|nr:ATP-binding protein [Dongiaceae bacterium]